MKNKIRTVLLFAGLIVVIGGAALLYNFLKDNVETEQLSVEESVNENKNTEDNGVNILRILFVNGSGAFIQVAAHE